MNSLQFAASALLAWPTALETAWSEFEKLGFQELHFRISDGTIAPDITLGPQFVAAARAACGLTCTAHLQTRFPERHIDALAEAGCQRIILPVESCVHLHRLLTSIRDAGPAAGVAVNPATPLTKLDYALDFVDRVLLHAREPASMDPGMFETTPDRAGILHEYLMHRRSKATIAVDGVANPRDMAAVAAQGGALFVIGEDCLEKNLPPAQAWEQFTRALRAKQALS